MIILAPGALDRVFTVETSATNTGGTHTSSARAAAAHSRGTDSRFADWLTATPQDSSTRIANGGAQSTPYRNRPSRFE